MKITVDEKLFLGYSHCGSVWANAHGEFEMADADVETLVALIRKKGTTDIKKLGIKRYHRDIYQLLEKEIYRIYDIAGTAHFVREAIDDYFEYEDELIDYCMQKYGFNPDEEDEDYEEEDEVVDYEDENEEYDAKLHSKFVDWVRCYADTLSDKEVVDFFHDTIDPGIGLDPRKFDLTIPQQIIDMAGGDKYIIFNIAEIDGDILWVNHNTSRSVDDVEEDEFSAILTNSVWLTNDEVTSIIDLIRKTKTTDVYRMNLSEIYPDIYRKIDKSIAKHLDDLDLGGLRADYNVILPQRIIDMAKEGDN